MADDVARDAQRGLVPVAVSGQRLHFAVREQRRVAQGDFPFFVEQVAGLHVETLPVVDEGSGFGAEQRVAARTAHEIGVEGEAPVFEDEIDEIGPQVACGVAGHHGSPLTLQPRGLVVVGVGSGEQNLHPLLEFVVALDDVALRLEASQRIEFQTPRIGQPSGRRTAPVAAFAQRDGALCREVEALAVAHVVFAEEPEVAVEVEFAVDDAPVDELQGARRVDPRAVGLDLGLPEADVPGGVGHVVDDGVAHDVHVAAGQQLCVVGGESQLDRVDQFGRIDVTVEAQPQPFDAGFGLGEREVVVERQRQKVLHAEAHRQFEPVVFGPEGDALADLDVGHVAQLCQQFAGRIGRDDFGAEVAFLRRRDLRPLLCRGQRPAGGQQEQDREFFHRIFLLILFRLHVGQKYKKYAESGEPRCKVGA